jgi:hypothetical protein
MLFRFDLLPNDGFTLLAATTIRAIVMDSEMMDRTRGLLFSISLDSTRASFTAATRLGTTARAPADFSGDAAVESGVRKQALSKYCRVSPQCWHLMTGLCSIGSISPGTLQGRASMTLLHAAQRVCQCRYGAALFSIVSASRFDGERPRNPSLGLWARFALQTVQWTCTGIAGYAVSEGGNVRPAVLVPDEGFAVSEYGRQENIADEQKANT